MQKKTTLYKWVTAISTIISIIGFLLNLDFNLYNSILIRLFWVLLVGYIIPEINNTNGCTVINLSELAYVYGVVFDLLENIVSANSLLANSGQSTEIYILLILLGMAMLIVNILFGKNGLLNKEEQKK